MLQDEPTNPMNDAAVRVCSVAGVPLGYVPDLLLDYLRVVRDGPHGAEVRVEHVNDDIDVPSHFRLLVCLDGRVPPGYRPMTGPGWEPYAD